MKYFIISIAISIAIFTQLLCAQEAPRLSGAEFTFFVGDNRDKIFSTRDALTDFIVDNCTDCTFSKQLGTIVFSNGFWMEINIDPTVVEVQALPIPEDRLGELIPLIQKNLFDMAAKIGLFPHQKMGGGHISFDTEGLFQGETFLFRDFLVDFFNHPEIANGLLGERSDPNSPHILQLPQESEDAFRKIIKDFDEKPSDYTIDDLMRRIEYEAYTETLWEGQKPYWENMKYQALAFHNERMEIRSVATQARAENFRQISLLYYRRVDYLREQRAQGNIVQLEGRTLQAKQARVDRFKRYVRQAGLPWEEYAALIPTHFLDEAWESIGYENRTSIVSFLINRIENFFF